MSIESNVKQDVRQFYDKVGWQEVSDGVYQNAHYEDLRPVAGEYIRRCHLRVLRHLKPQGDLLLDAGSGPIQYPEYLEYAGGYGRRVCADISIVALKEARKRIGTKGFFVVADIANLPFRSGAFDGAVSLHTIHHLPEGEHLGAYREMQRVLTPGSQAVVVNGWPGSRLMRAADPFIRLSNRVKGLARRISGKSGREKGAAKETALSTVTLSTVTLSTANQKAQSNHPKGTFTSRHDAAWIKTTVGAQIPVKIWVWRSVSVRFLRAMVHPWLGGRFALRLLFWLEERFPHFLGENGQYPLIVIRKP